jgi:hypothetical protein
VFVAAGFDVVRLGIVVDDLSSPPHDKALLEAGGVDKLDISVARACHCGRQSGSHWVRKLVG